MNLKEANTVLCEFIEDNSCMCLVHRLCPSPSAHHDYCLNENCKKKITDTSYRPYILSLDSLSLVWSKINTEYPEYSGLIFSSTIRNDGSAVEVQSVHEPQYEGFQVERIEDIGSVQSTFAMATATAILKIKNLI